MRVVVPEMERRDHRSHLNLTSRRMCPVASQQESLDKHDLEGQSHNLHSATSLSNVCLPSEDYSKIHSILTIHHNTPYASNSAYCRKNTILLK